MYQVDIQTTYDGQIWIFYAKSVSDQLKKRNSVNVDDVKVDLWLSVVKPLYA